jgi:hypothetical protein
MRFRLYRNVPSDRVKDHVPRDWAGRLPPPRSDVQYTLLVFGENQGVVHGALAAKAVRRLPESDGNPVLAVAHEFTEEARSALAGHVSELVTRQDWHWTDRSHEEIKLLTKLKVKGPDHR